MMEPLIHDWPRKADRALQINTKKNDSMMSLKTGLRMRKSLICRYLLMAR